MLHIARMQAGQLLATALAAIGFVAAAFASLHALLNKRRPQSAFGWIAICLTLPLLGALLYYLFGINRVQTRARKLLTSPSGTRVPHGVRRHPAAAARAAGAARLRRQRLAADGGNSIELLHEAGAIFDAMIGAIEAAREYVYFSTYIFDGGPLGRRFAAALSAAAERGADVRVLLDGVGEWYSWPRAGSLFQRHARALRAVPAAAALAADDQHEPAQPSQDPRRRRSSKRSRAESTSATAISTRTATRNRRFALSFERPGARADRDGVPARLAVRDRRRNGRGAAACRNPPAPRCAARWRTDPTTGLDRLTALLTGAIGSARQRVAIMTPYFVPPRELIAPLQAAALAGVDVAVILPARNNLPYVHRATRHMLWELLERGVHVYYQPPPFVHSKLFYVDDYYAQIGSANFDSRSLRLNFEMNIEVYDRDTVSGACAALRRRFAAARRP